MDFLKKINKCRFEAFFWACVILSLFGCIWITEEFHFPGLDGQYFKYLAEEAVVWFRPTTNFSNCPMHGIGGFSYPYNFLLSPIFSPSLYLYGKCDSRLVYTTAALILIMSALVIGRAFKVSKKDV